MPDEIQLHWIHVEEPRPSDEILEYAFDELRETVLRWSVESGAGGVKEHHPLYGGLCGDAHPRGIEQSGLTSPSAAVMVPSAAIDTSETHVCSRD